MNSNTVVKIEETRSNLNTVEQVREYVKTVDRFKCRVHYEYDLESNSEESRWTPCSSPDFGGTASFNFDDESHGWSVKGSIGGTASVSSEDYFYQIEELESDPPKTHAELHTVINQMILDDVKRGGYEGEIEVDDLEEVMKEQ